MNEKPEGGPKPLKVNPSADPLVQPRPVPKPMNTAPAKERVIAPSITSFAPARAHVNPAPIKPAPAPAKPAAPAAEPKPAAAPAPAAEPAKNPAPAPAEPKPTADDKPKSGKNKKIIIGVIIACVVLILGAIAAFLTVTFLNADNRVSAATAKLLSGEKPRYAQFDGKIEITSGSGTAADTNTMIFDGRLDSETGAYQINANTSIDAGTGNAFNITFSQLRDTEGDYYMDLSNFDNLITEMISSEALGDSVDEEDLSTVRSLLSTAMTTALDGKWLQLPDAESATGLVSTESDEDQAAICWLKTITDMPNFGADAKSLYEKNPFITYTKDNLGIAQKANNLYRLTINNEKLAAFINATANSDAKNLLGCAGAEIYGDVTALNVSKLFPNNLELYTEIDKDNNFTRLYVKNTSDAGSFVLDLDVSYPGAFVIETPSEVIDLTGLTQAMLEALVPEEPEPITPVEDNSYWYEPDYDYNYDSGSTAPSNSSNNYSEPAQNIDNSTPNQEFDPGV